jgi:hypothetical protein
MNNKIFNFSSSKNARVILVREVDSIRNLIISIYYHHLSITVGLLDYPYVFFEIGYTQNKQ